MAQTVIHVDYDSPDQHPGVVSLRPVIYAQDGAYCCMSGPNPVQGIFGFGLSVEEALDGWIKSYERKK